MEWRNGGKGEFFAHSALGYLVAETAQISFFEVFVYDQ